MNINFKKILIPIYLILLSYNVLAEIPGVIPVDNKLYAEECGSCHFAYQPGLMPARSWQKIMKTLDDHFGENAELETEEQQVLMDYLIYNSAESSIYRHSVNIERSTAWNQTPLRIANISYIRFQHDDFMEDMLKYNPQIKSRSYCNDCHTKAKDGIYADGIDIPGYGKWDMHGCM
ncbi:diacylglycerol kinase [Candidatus Halobeggiatoa sp. HSG11]|nr:diacylglycerol kinase [Candidatus Halobeggiatoa sp. HSG11]